MRSADEDREISRQQLRNLMLSVSDSIVNIESNNQNLTFDQLKTLYAGNNLTLRENTFAQNLNLLTRSGAYNLMANILADVNSYSIKVAVFRGTDKTDLIKRNEYGYKCMLVAVKQVLDYMEALNDTTVDVGGSLRKESKMFDFSCFREAWLNACLHNRWSKQTPPAVYVFDDRIEIISIGGLPDGLSLDEFYEGKSKPVNLELQQIMVQLDYIEQTGHGVPLIISKYGRKVFDITENFITVTILLKKSRIEKINVQTVKKQAFDEYDGKILRLMKEDSSVKVSEINKKIGIGTTTITKRIRRLREQGIIERIGSKKDGKWMVNG